MFEGIKRFAGNLFGGGGGSGYKYKTDDLGLTAEWTTNDPIPKRGPFDFMLDKSSDRYSDGNLGGGGFNFGNAFSGKQALEGFKGLLDVSRAQGDRRTQGSYGQGFGFQGYGGSRAGQGAFLGGTPGYSSSLYLPAETPYGGGGSAGGGGKPSRMAKALGGAAALAPLGPVGAGIGAVAGFLS